VAHVRTDKEDEIEQVHFAAEHVRIHMAGLHKHRGFAPLQTEMSIQTISECECQYGAWMESVRGWVSNLGGNPVDFRDMGHESISRRGIHS
jgi:hypothetical protein